MPQGAALCAKKPRQERGFGNSENRHSRELILRQCKNHQHAAVLESEPEHNLSLFCGIFHFFVELLGVFDRFSIDLLNERPRLDTGVGADGTLLDLGDKDAFEVFVAVAACNVIGEVLDGKSELFDGFGLAAGSKLFGGRAFLKFCGKCFLFPVAQDDNLNLGAGLFHSDFLLQLSGLFDRPAFELNNDVVRLDTRLVGGRAGRDIGYNDSFRILKLELLGNFGREVLDADAEETAGNTAFFNKLLIDGLWRC
jgi:hypothetical protein